MIFTAEEARGGVEETKLRNEKERKAKKFEDDKNAAIQRLRAKEDLPVRMMDIQEWIKKMVDKEQTSGTFAMWKYHGQWSQSPSETGKDVYYKELVALAIKELIELGFVASDRITEHRDFRSALSSEDVWTYPIHISWS